MGIGGMGGIRNGLNFKNTSEGKVSAPKPILINAREEIIPAHILFILSFFIMASFLAGNAKRVKQKMEVFKLIWSYQFFVEIVEIHAGIDDNSLAINPARQIAEEE
jgi:hypothetical protein